MDAMKMAMYEISASVKDSNRLSTELTQNVKDLNSSMAIMEEKMDNKFDDVNAKFQEQDNKTKIDWAKCFTNGGWMKAVEILTLIGLISYIVLGNIGIL